MGEQVEEDRNNLLGAEHSRTSSLNARLNSLKKSLVAGSTAELEQQLSTLQSNREELKSLGNDLSAIESAEKECEAANIEENEKTDLTYDDLWFAYSLLSKAYDKNIDLIQNQITAGKTEDVSAEQIEEFKETFKHFDQNKNDKLNRLEFKSCLSGLGIIELDFEGGDKRFESIFNKVADGGETVDFQQFLKYMISITKDENSPEQLEDSFHVLAGGKDHVTVNDMKVGQLSAEQIQHLTTSMPAKEGIEGDYDYKAYVRSLFSN